MKRPSSSSSKQQHIFHFDAILCWSVCRTDSHKTDTHTVLWVAHNLIAKTFILYSLCLSFYKKSSSLNLWMHFTSALFQFVHSKKKRKEGRQTMLKAPKFLSKIAYLNSRKMTMLTTISKKMKKKKTFEIWAIFTWAGSLTIGSSLPPLKREVSDFHYENCCDSENWPEISIWKWGAGLNLLGFVVKLAIFIELLSQFSQGKVRWCA